MEQKQNECLLESNDKQPLRKRLIIVKRVSEPCHDKFIEWSDKSKDVPFKSTLKCVGNGEEKLIKEFDITTAVGGQNSTVDLLHPTMGCISVKDMTFTDCTLGTEGCSDMRKLFRTIINPLVSWVLKYKTNCELAEKIYNDINKNYGSSKITILEGIDRYELSCSNLSQLNQIFNNLKKYKLETRYDSLKSEYIDDIITSLGEDSLHGLLDKCVCVEATKMTLIIVHEMHGWLIVKNISRLSCPRITRGAPRINYNWL